MKSASIEELALAEGGTKYGNSATFGLEAEDQQWIVFTVYYQG
jgi:hypothetical protein